MSLKTIIAATIPPMIPCTASRFPYPDFLLAFAPMNAMKTSTDSVARLFAWLLNHSEGILCWILLSAESTRKGNRERTATVLKKRVAGRDKGIVLFLSCMCSFLTDDDV